MDCNDGAALARAFSQQQGPMMHGHHHEMGGQMDGDGMHGASAQAHHGPMLHDHGPMGPGVSCPAGGGWANEFAHSGHHQQLHMDHQHDAIAEQEYLAMMHEQEGAEMEAAFAEAQVANGVAEDDWANQFQGQQDNNEEWATEFNSEDVQTFGLEGEALKTVAEKTSESQFFKFMDKVRTGEVVINDEAGTIEGPKNDADWGKEFDGTGHAGVSAENWHEELAKKYGDDADEECDYDTAWNNAEDAQNGAGEMERAWGSDEDDDFAERYLQAAKENGAENWLEEYQELTRNAQAAHQSSDYPFDPNNPYLFHDDPLGEGRQLLAAGTLSEAVLAFEAACQKEPLCEEAWRLLGTTQAENEKDTLAIRALNRAREINPRDLAVHLALSVSHCNESNHTQALMALKGWLLANPQYEQLGSITMEPNALDADEGMDGYSKEFLFISPSEHRDCCTLFNAARELNPADAELHVCLGILKNLSHDFEEAAVHFHDALQFRQDDPKLWNKLGATLANGSKSQEALAAYDRALDLNPGYVRAQYNLGIAHSNLSDYQAASRHLVRAIVMQQGGITVPDPPTRSTREMWDVLRMNLNLMDRGDLVEVSWKQDVVPFLHELGLSDLL